MQRYALFLLSLLPVVQGCSSSYQPARSPRITTVALGSAPVFIKDGQSYGGPMFGSGLIEAVHGNPRAEKEARTARNLVVAGVVFDLAGLGSEAAGLVVLGHDAQLDHAKHPAAGATLLLGGLVSLAVGSVLLLCSPPHTYDAINIYNDGLDAPH